MHPWVLSNYKFMTSFTNFCDYYMLIVKYKCSKFRISEANWCNFIKILFPEDDHVLASHVPVVFLVAFQTKYLIYPFTAVQEHTLHFKGTSCTLHIKQASWTEPNFLAIYISLKTSSVFFSRVVQHLSLPGAMLFSVIESVVWKRYVCWARILTICW